MFVAEKMRLTEQQQAVVDNRGGALLVAAAAGSGKTKVLVDRMMDRICNEGVNVDDFLIITFTKAAASELRAKITSALMKKLAEAPHNKHIQMQIHLVYAAQISTVHAFCANLLRSNAALAGVSADFIVGDEQICKGLQMRAMEEMLEGSAYRDLDQHPNVKAFIDELAFGRDDSAVPGILYAVYNTIMAHPFPEQWEAECLAHMDVSGCADIAETIWGNAMLAEIKSKAKASRDMAAWARELCDKDEVISAAYSGNITSDLARIDAILESDTWNGLYRQSANAGMKWEMLGRPKRKAEFDVAIQDAVKTLRNRYKKTIDKLLAPIQPSAEMLEDLTKTEPSVRGMFELVDEFKRRYDHKKSLQNVLDFNDLEHLTIKMLVDPETGKPSKAAEALRGRYVEIMVDEYQDTNAVQETIFSALSDNNRFMVGDVKQSIYAFRLADPTIFLDHYTKFRPYNEAQDNEPRKILLSKNFRSRPEILEATNAVMSACMSPTVGGLVYGEQEALQAGRTEVIPQTEPVVELVAINTGTPIGAAPVKDSEEADDAEEGSKAKAEIEAAYVAKRIHDMIGVAEVTDEETGTARKAKVSDFAIIMRSAKNSAKYYIKALAEYGIACKSPKNGSILDTTEISTLYAYLQIIDNPMQDIPLVAVLASPLEGFSTDDLVCVRMAKPTSNTYYEALVEYAKTNRRAAEFVERLSEMRRQSSRTKLSRLFSALLEATDADYVFGAMKNGDQRMANIHKFAEMIAGYESGGTRGLFEFIAYIESLRAQGAELAQASASAADEAVTITTVHGSKGLEYPIVFLSDLSRRFNMGDQSKTVLLHKDLGIGVQRLNKQLLHRYPTIARTAISDRIAAESKSEELRILYVAMTRAKEKLIMTYADKMSQTLARLGENADVVVAPSVAAAANNPGEWILLSALSRKEAFLLQRLAGYVPAETVDSPYEWGISLLEAGDVVNATHHTMEELESAEDDDSDDVDDSTFLRADDIPELDVDKLEHDINFVYAHQTAVDTPAKAVASAIYAAKEGKVSIERPDFAKKQSGFTAAERGTATHLFMQFADHGKCYREGKVGIQSEISRLVMAQRITAEESKAILVPALAKFFGSAAGEELANLPAGQTYRETPFTILLPANEVDAQYDGAEETLVQGIIDLYTIDGDDIALYDYKTDHVSDDAEMQAKAAHYKMQMDLYCKALTMMYPGKTVRTRKLIFLRAGEQIAC